MRISLFLFFIAMSTSCTTGTDPGTPAGDSGLLKDSALNEGRGDVTGEPLGVADDLDGCYMQVLKRDTFVLTVDQTGKMLSGKLTFDNYEKDGSTGRVNGIADGDTLKLWYSFASEGMNSVMQIYFRKNSNTLVRGLGPMDVKSDTTYYTDPGAMEYTEGQALSKILCEEVPEKYK